MIKPVTLSNAPGIPLNLDRRIIFTSQKVEVVHLTLNPGEEISLHSNPFNVVFYLLQGELVLKVDEDAVTLSPYYAASVQANQNRGVPINPTSLP